MTLETQEARFPQGQRAPSNDLDDDTVTESPSRSSNNGSKRQLPFAKVPTQVARDASLSIYARHIYTLLVSYAWQDGSTWVSQSTLAKDMGLKRQAVIQPLRELERADLIIVKRKPGRNNLYIIRELSGDLSLERDNHQSQIRDTTKTHTRRETETALEKPFPENGNGSHNTSTPLSPSFGGNEETAPVPNMGQVPDQGQVENRNGGSGVTVVPVQEAENGSLSSGVRLRLLRVADDDPRSLLSGDLHQLRTTLRDDSERGGEPCSLHFETDCLRCVELGQRLSAELQNRIRIPS